MSPRELQRRTGRLALREKTTVEALIAGTGIRASTLRRAAAGTTALDTATAVRLLPLVAKVAEPGEPIRLTLTIPGVLTPVFLTTAPLP